MSLIAELTSVTLDPNEIILAKWDEQVNYQSDQIWKCMNYVSKKFFTEYFKVLLNKCESSIGFDIKGYNIMVQDLTLMIGEDANKMNFLNRIHVDSQRMCCLTIPIKSNHLEPVCFYDDSVSDQATVTKERPLLVHRYNSKFPSLVNTRKKHKVRLMDESPRILLQIEYDVSFDEIVAKNPSIWKTI